MYINLFTKHTARGLMADSDNDNVQNKISVWKASRRVAVVEIEQVKICTHVGLCERPSDSKNEEHILVQ